MPVTCTNCNRNFANSNSLSTHRSKYHPDQTKMTRSVKITSKPKDEKSLKESQQNNDARKDMTKSEEKKRTSGKKKHFMTNKFDLLKLLNALNESFDKLEEDTNEVKPLLIDLESTMKRINPTKQEEILLRFIKNVIRSRMATHNIKVTLKRLGYI